MTEYERLKAQRTEIELRQESQKDKRIRELEAEVERAMNILKPNMPESGLVDACCQVKQAAISNAENCGTLERLLEVASQQIVAADHRSDALEAENATLCAKLERAEALIKPLLDEHTYPGFREMARRYFEEK